MPLQIIPWVIGAFMITPFAVWLVLALVLFPGVWNGFDKVVGMGALLPTIPLVGWFFVRGIGSFANSMAGGHPDGRLVHRVPRLILQALPALALALGIAGAAVVALADQPLWTLAAPLATATVIAVAILAGERAAMRLPSRPF